MRARLIVAAMVLFGGLALVGTTPAAVADGTTSTRLSGTNRFETAAAMARAKFPNGVPSVVLASGLTFADALAGSYYAGGASAACPQSAILLTLPDTLAPATRQAITDLHATTVTILGGTSAVSDDVLAQLQGPGMTVRRIGGHNRFETMLDLITACAAPSTTAFIASGLNFPDALSAGGASYGKHIPIILTLPDQLSPEAQQALTSLGVTRVLIMGGAAAVSPAVNAALTGMGISVAQQFAGHDRGDTAALFATWAVANLGFSKTDVALARGDSFADALAGSQVTGDPEVTLLTDGADNLWPASVGYLLKNRPSRLSILGGTSAISPANVLTATSAADGQGPPALAVTDIAPRSIPMDNAPDRGFLIEGTFPEAVTVHLFPSADNPNAGPDIQSCADGSHAPGLTVRSTTSTLVTVGINVPDLCPPGPYDILMNPADGSPGGLVVSDAITLRGVVTGLTPATIANDGSVVDVSLTGRGFVNGLTASILPHDPNAPTTGPCGDTRHQVDLTGLVVSGWSHADGTVLIPPGCPTGSWDIAIDQTAKKAGTDLLLDGLTVGVTQRVWVKVVTVSACSDSGSAQPLPGATVTIGNTDVVTGDDGTTAGGGPAGISTGPQTIHGHGTVLSIEVTPEATGNGTHLVGNDQSYDFAPVSGSNSSSPDYVVAVKFQSC